MSKVLVDDLFPKVSQSLKDKSNLKKFKENLDRYMAHNAEIYAAIGPYKRPIFSDKNIDDLITLVGLTRNEIKASLKRSPYIKSTWVEANKPFNVAISLVIRHFLIEKDEGNVDNALSYLIVSMYPILHYRYFQYEPNEAALTYTLNNLSNKFNLRQNRSLWVTLKDMATVCLNHFQKVIVEGTDKAIVDFIESLKTRMNSFLKKIRGEFNEVYQKKLYLGNEFESFEEDNFHEASSDATAIETISNKVVSSLVIHGPDMRIVALCAKNCKASSNMLRSYLSTMITNEQRDDIQKIVECLLHLYLQSEDSKGHTISGIGSNDFLIHCMKIYKKSHTIDENVVKIKEILDRWLVELKITEHTSNEGTLNNFRRAIYMFFVLSIVKLN